jgi:hypothetical protein
MHFHLTQKGPYPVGIKKFLDAFSFDPKRALPAGIKKFLDAFSFHTKRALPGHEDFFG